MSAVARAIRDAFRRRPAPVPPPVFVPPPIPSSGEIRVFRVTSDQDGDILNRGYSYWPASVAYGDLVDCFVGHADGRPRFFRVHLDTGEIERFGPLVRYAGTGEGWYYSGAGELYLCDGPRLRRVHPHTGTDTIVLDISDRFPDCRLWQAHSSEDGQRHSATVERITDSGPYQRLGTIVAHPGGLEFYGAQAPLDESHLTPDGRYLVIEEGGGNRIIDLQSYAERRIADADGALSHLDCGPGYIVGEDNHRGACTYLDLQTLDRRVLFETWHQGVVSVRSGRCVVTGATTVDLVALDGSGATKLLEHGMTVADPNQPYDYQARASLSPCGLVATFVSNREGRMNLYLVQL